MVRHLRGLPGLGAHQAGMITLSAGERAVAWFGLAVGIAMALMKVVPLVPGHFTVYEWIALGSLDRARSRRSHSSSATWKRGP